MYNVFVFCGGKCGGSTLAETFDKNNYKAIHLHGFNCAGFNNPGINLTNIHDILENSCKNYKHVFVIDSYRNPIERKVSAFFQNINIHLPNYENLTIEEIINFFNKNLLNDIENYHSINNILDYYKIPRFKKFDFENGYNLCKKDNKIFIKILFKDIKNWDKILSKIFKKNIVIHPKNLTKDKENNKLYEAFKKNYRIPKEYLENVLTKDTEFQIYNTQEEQDKYLKKWLAKSF
jgi:hypothetical protein